MNVRYAAAAMLFLERWQSTFGSDSGDLVVILKHELETLNLLLFWFYLTCLQRKNKTNLKLKLEKKNKQKQKKLSHFQQVPSVRFDFAQKSITVIFLYHHLQNEKWYVTLKNDVV